MKRIRPLLLTAIVCVALSTSACRTWFGEGDAPDTRLIKADEKVTSLSYEAQVNSGGKDFLCEALIRSDGSVRRTWNWEEGGKKHSYMEVMLKKKGFTVMDDGSEPVALDSAQIDSLLFFSNLFMSPQKALTVDRDSILRQPDAETVPGSDIFNVKFFSPEMKDGTLMLATDTGLWTSLQYTKRDGSRIRINFTEYQRVGNNYFPSKTVTDFNGSETTALIRDVCINPELPDGLFELEIK